MSDYFVWEVFPILFKIPLPVVGITLEVRYYGVFFACMALGAFLLWRWQMRRGGYGDRVIEAWFFVGVVSLILGAHLGHAFFYSWDYYRAHPWEIIIFRGRGLSSHGATVGVMLGLLAYSRYYRIPLLVLFDANAFPAALAAMMVRLGNFFNSEIVGRVTTVPWAVRFVYYEDGGANPRHPSQLYEFLLGAVVMAALVLVDRRYGARRPRGLLAGVFGTIYFAGRFFVEFFKEYQTLDPAHSFLTMGQYLSAPFFLISLYLLVSALRRGSEPAGSGKGRVPVGKARTARRKS